MWRLGLASLRGPLGGLANLLFALRAEDLLDSPRHVFRHPRAPRCTKRPADSVVLAQVGGLAVTVDPASFLPVVGVTHGVTVAGDGYIVDAACRLRSQQRMPRCPATVNWRGCHGAENPQ